MKSHYILLFKLSLSMYFYRFVKLHGFFFLSHLSGQLKLVSYILVMLKITHLVFMVLSLGHASYH